MSILATNAIKYNGKELSIIDQQLLPHEEFWLNITTPEEMVTAIHQLKVRGAPLIGVAASLYLALYSKSCNSLEDFNRVALLLREARPTAVNLMNNIDHILNRLHSDSDIQQVESIALEIFKADELQCQNISKVGAALVPSKCNILTHCNTGGLATAGLGTALGVIKQAHKDGKNIHVYVDETRPLLQGARLTAWELFQESISFKLICDNMSAFLMAQKKVDMIVVGADRIAANGDFANKIGTYNLAVLAQYHNIPFYVVAPSTTIDLECSSGKAIPIEERPSHEVQGVFLHSGTTLWAKEDFPTYNPAFDVTPSELITGWIFETGVYSKKDIDNKILQQIVKGDL